MATITGPCVVKAAKDGVTVVEGAATSVHTHEGPGSQHGPCCRATSTWIAWEAVACGELSSPPPPPLAVTVDPYILTTTPTVTWYARQKYDSFHVVLQDATTHAVVFQQEAPGTASEVKVPAGKLAWNKKYDVYLTAKRGGRDRSTSAGRGWRPLSLRRSGAAIR